MEQATKDGINLIEGLSKMFRENVMKKNEYKCDICQNVYEKGWTDEEAEQEVKEIWGHIPAEDRAVICDDCFNHRTPKEVKEMGNEYKSK
jgi:hypothetical protein